MDKVRRVRDIYHKGLIMCRPDSPLQEVTQLMADAGVHIVMVAEAEGKFPIGVVSHIDVIAHYGRDLTTIQAHEVMHPDVVAIAEDATIDEAVKKLLDHGVWRLLVVDKDNIPLGTLSTTDVIRELRGARWVWHLD